MNCGKFFAWSEPLTLTFFSSIDSQRDLFNPFYSSGLSGPIPPFRLTRTGMKSSHAYSFITNSIPVKIPKPSSIVFGYNLIWWSKNPYSFCMAWCDSSATAIFSKNQRQTEIWNIPIKFGMTGDRFVKTPHHVFIGSVEFNWYTIIWNHHCLPSSKNRNRSGRRIENAYRNIGPVYFLMSVIDFQIMFFGKTSVIWTIHSGIFMPITTANSIN